MSSTIFLVGAGGHCRSCIDVIESTGKWTIAGIVGQPAERGSQILGYPIRYTDEDLPSLCPNNFLVTVGQIQSSHTRARLFERLSQLDANLPSIVSPHAYVSHHASLGAGTIVMHHAMVNANAQVHNNCIINSKALIEHDATIGPHCHIATGAIINGGVTVGANSFVGSAAITQEGSSIPAHSVIGAASWVDHQTITRGQQQREL